MRRFVLFSQVVTCGLLGLGVLFPSFDAAASSLLLRWDAIHYLHIARSGYVYEHEWAWLPGLPFLMALLPDSPFAIALVSLAVSFDASSTMYRLSLHHLRSPSLARLAALLALLPSSPVTLLIAPYCEPFFTYLSYKGMLYCATSSYFAAALCFTLAATFRSNGFFLSGFIIWGLLVQPFLERKRISFRSLLACTVFAALPLLPFIAHNYTAYLFFCSNRDERPEWCSKPLPLIYSHVQVRYWNNGFLRYWTLQQLPNFVIAAPPLISISAFSIQYLCRWIKRPAAPGRTFRSPSIAPHAIHALIMCAILLFASNTQIILRLAASMPITYWAAAWLLVEYPKYGRAWVAWSIVWGALSILLWAAFLPPA